MMLVTVRTSRVRTVIPSLKSFAIFIAFRPQLFKTNLHLVDSAIDFPKLIHWIFFFLVDSAIQHLKRPVVISGTACEQWIFCNLTCTTLRDGPLFNQYFQIVAVYLTLFTYLQCLTKGAKYGYAVHLSLLTEEGKSTDYEINFQIPALIHWFK